MLRKQQAAVIGTVALFEFLGPIYIGSQPVPFEVGDILSADDLEGVNIPANVQSGALRRLTAGETETAIAQMEAQAIPSTVETAEVEPVAGEAVEPVSVEAVAVDSEVSPAIGAESDATAVVETSPADQTPPAPAEVEAVEPASSFGSRRGRSY